MTYLKKFDLSYLLPIISGILLAFSQPPYPTTLLVWGALVPLFFFLTKEKITYKKILLGGFIAGSLYGLIYFYNLTSLSAWGWSTLSSAWKQKLFIYALWLFLSFLAGGFVLGFFSLLFRYFYLKFYSSLSTLVIPFIWISLEYLRTKIFLNYTWGQLGYALHNQPTFLQFASLAGLSGLSLLIVLGNLIIFYFLKGLKEKNWKIYFQKNFILAGFVIFLFLILVYGFYQLNQKEKNKDKIKIAILQGNIGTEEFREARLESYKTIFNKIYLPMAEKAFADGAEVVVIPESSFPEITLGSIFFNQKGLEESLKLYFEDISSTYKKGVIGGIDLFRPENGKAYSNIVFWDQNKFIGYYSKRYLVPFAEYNPLPKFLKSFTLISYTPGNSSAISEVQGIKWGGLLCSEVIFPELARLSTIDGAEVLALLGNEEAFDSPQITKRELALAQVRAVENGRYLIKATKAGISAFINPKGTIISSSPLNKNIILEDKIIPLKEKTVYTRFGDWLVWLGLGVFLFALIKTRKK